MVGQIYNRKSRVAGGLLKLMVLQLGSNATGFKQRKLSLVLWMKATEKRNDTLPKNGPPNSLSAKRTISGPIAGDTSAYDYDPLYVNSSGEGEQMEDIQSSSPLSGPLPSASPDDVLTSCFKDLLRARDEVRVAMIALVPILSFNQIAAKHKFANADDLIHQRSVHHLSLLTVEGETYAFLQ